MAPRRKSKAKRSVRKAVASRPLTITQREQVKSILLGELETKTAIWYSGTGGNAGSGLANQAAIQPQNQMIATNNSDILRILPRVFMGTNDNQRIGQKISPVSCKVRCKVQINANAPNNYGYKNGYSYNIVAVAYCLQHVKYKSYDTLIAQNAFNEMLVTGENSTNTFSGQWHESDQQVSPLYYKLLGKKTMRLRSSGTELNAAAGQNPNFEGTNMNSAPLTHEWTWDLTKQLPAKLLYPEETAGFLQDSPVNSAPFWCVGFYQDSGVPLGSAQPQITQQYVTTLRYKDA